MHVHLPKPLHGWREFAGEVGIIVLGVLIALGLEQTVESIHERQLAREANEAIHTEMQEDVDRINARLGQQPCLDRRLDQIADVLGQWNQGKIPAPGLIIGVPSDIPMVDQRWQANLNSGRFNQQSPAEQADQAAFYTSVAILDQILKREHDAWSELRTLELGPTLLSADMRGNLVGSLQSARTDANDLTALGRHVSQVFEHTGGVRKRSRELFAITAGICGPIHPGPNIKGKG